MTLSQCEVAQLAVTFTQEHATQIAAKAACYGEPVADVRQNARVIILELGKKYDPAKGSLCQFVFGHLEKRNLRQNGAHRFAISLNDEKIIEEVESLPDEAGINNDEDFFTANTPLAGMIRAIAHFMSGKSTAELAQLLALTSRRVRQILQELRQTKPGSNEFEPLVKTFYTRLLMIDPGLIHAKHPSTC